MLLISRKKGETIVIGDQIEITVLEVHGDKVKIGIEAPRDVRVVRKELLETEKVNQEANALQANSLKNLIDSIKNIK